MKIENSNDKQGVLFRVSSVRNKDVTLSFTGSDISSDGGLVLLKECEQQVGNNFNELVDEYHHNGISQDILSPGKSDTYTWDLYGSTATPAKAYVYRIDFTDGSTWEVNP